MEFQTGGISKIWPEDKQHIICLCQKYGADHSILGYMDNTPSNTLWKNNTSGD